MLFLKHHFDYPSDSLIKIESRYTRCLSQLEEKEVEENPHYSMQSNQSLPLPSAPLSPLKGSFDTALHLNILDYDLPEIYGCLLAVFKKLRIMDILDITPSRLLDFFIDVRETYQETPYHSFKHACDVVMMLYSNYTELKNNRQEVDFMLDLETAVIFIAAICHDAGHNGRNNDFHERTKSPLTTRFKKHTTSYLESLSVEIALDLIEKHRLFQAFPTMEEKCIIHDWIETTILLTDMKHHHDLLQMAKILRKTLDRIAKDMSDDLDEEDIIFGDHEEKPINDKAHELLCALETSYSTINTALMHHTPAETNDKGSRSDHHHSGQPQHLLFKLDEDDDWASQQTEFATMVSSTTSITTSNIPLTTGATEGIFMTPPSSMPFSTSPSPLDQFLSQSSPPPSSSTSLSPKQRLGLACVLLHAADISNPIRPWNISKQWSDLVVEEFYKQGDDEKQAGFPTISPGMDRDLQTQASTGIKFNSIVKTYFEEVAGILALPPTSNTVAIDDGETGSPRTKTNILLDFLNANTVQWEELNQCPLATSLTSKTTSKTIITAHANSTATPSTSVTIHESQQQQHTQQRKMMSVSAGTVRMPLNNNFKVRPLPIVRTTSHSSFLFSPPTSGTMTTTSSHMATHSIATATSSKRYHHLQNTASRRNSSDVVA